MKAQTVQQLFGKQKTIFGLDAEGRFRDRKHKGVQMDEVESTEVP